MNKLSHSNNINEYINQTNSIRNAKSSLIGDIKGFDRYSVNIDYMKPGNISVNYNKPSSGKGIIERLRKHMLNIW